MGKSRRGSNGGGDGGQPEPTPTPVEQSITDEQWQNAKTAEQLAELTGWEFTETQRGSYKFYDAEHDMTLFIDKTMLTNKFIDKNSTGNLTVNQDRFKGGISQNLNDIVKAVYELPEDNKYGTPAIIFRNRFATNTLGSSGGYIDRFTSELLNGHAVYINSSCFKNGDGHSIRRTLLHESYHSLDRMMSSGMTAYTQMGISTKQSYHNAIKADLEKNGLRSVSWNSSNPRYKKYGYIYYAECWADAASVVKLKQMGYTNEKIRLPNKKIVTVDQWIDIFPETYKATVQEINHATRNNFQKPAEYNVIGNIITKNEKLNE